MDPRQRWQTLQTQLTIARTRLEAGDGSGALAAVDEALAIDPDFLAAQSLRERILSLSPAAFASSTRNLSPLARPAARDAPVKPAAAIDLDAAMSLDAPLDLDTLVGLDIPIKLDLPIQLEAPAQQAPRPTAEPAAPVPLVSTEGYAQFEQRAKRRRVDRRVEAARTAIALGRVKDAASAIDEVIELDPNLPDLPDLVAQFEALRRTSRPSHGGRWLAAAAVFAAIVLGASWLQESSGLRSRPVVSVGPLVVPPEPFGVTVVASESSDATSQLIGTTGDAAPEAQPAGTVTRADAREAVARAVNPFPTEGRASESVSPAVSPEPPTPPATQPAASATFAVQRPAVESSSPIAPVSATTSVPLPPPAPPVAATAPAAAATSLSAVAIPDDDALVKQVLQRYRTAYEGLDARSAHAVWPSVNEGALARAFGGLESQTLTFDACDVRLRGEAAAATCRGSARYVPKIGSHEPRSEPRTWTFTLRKSGNDWRIESARAER